MNKYKVIVKTSWDRIPSYTYLYITANTVQLFQGDDCTGDVTYLEVDTAIIEFETHDVELEKIK